MLSVIPIAVAVQMGGPRIWTKKLPGRDPLLAILYTDGVARVVPFTEARTGLTELIDELEQLHEHVIISRNGRPVAVLMSTDEYESLQETLEVLADEDLMKELAASERDVAEGRVREWSEVKRELGLA